VDIGMTRFSAADGIETIDATGATGPVRILGDWNANSLDFSGTSLVGNIVINGGGGNDTITGSAGNDTIEGGGWGNQTIDGGAGDDVIYADKGNDTVSGGEGNDIFRVSGNRCSNFEGWDSYAGGEGTDTIVVFGERVDVGLAAFSAANGIEVIDASGVTGQARILGDWNANTLDFSGTTLVGHVTIDGGGGNDIITGSAGAEVIRGGDSGNDVLGGGGGNDLMYGGNGRDVFVFDQGWARDTVADYRDNYDRLDFRNSGAAGFGDLTVAQVGIDTVITVGADEVVLLGINAASINQSDFIFA
jgi:Ca2+-binding RTX toxin-like protein